MALFVVIAPGKGEQLQETMNVAFPDDHFRLGDDSWLVSANGLTSRQVSDKLNITAGEQKGPNGPAAVLSVGTSYWGRYNTSLWDWMKVKLEASNA